MSEHLSKRRSADPGLIVLAIVRAHPLCSEQRRSRFAVKPDRADPPAPQDIANGGTTARSGGDLPFGGVAIERVRGGLVVCRPSGQVGLAHSEAVAESGRFAFEFCDVRFCKDQASAVRGRPTCILEKLQIDLGCCNFRRGRCSSRRFEITRNWSVPRILYGSGYRGDICRLCLSPRPGA